jgi:3-methyladenine DNA glycosylase/8-oxoguanine DNA glycosylase
MLRLDEDHLHVRRFHRLDDRWKKSGRARLFRSPTLFEDVIKTVTSCNVTWPSTVGMNRKLCATFGEKTPSGHFAFPSARTLSRQRPNTLRARCSVGYRDARIVELSRMFAKGELDPEFFEDPVTPDEAIRERLIELPGIGPYAAANILQLLGRYGHLPLDTESVRHGRTVLGFRGSSRAVMRRVGKHFAPFGEHKFRSYWFEMWCFYEAKQGQAHTWEREKTATAFTASKL